MTFREIENTSALPGFHAGPPSWLSWNLEVLGLLELGKSVNPEKTMTNVSYIWHRRFAIVVVDLMSFRVEYLSERRF